MSNVVLFDRPLSAKECGDNLRRIRLAAGLTVDKAARIMRMEPGAYRRLEDGTNLRMAAKYLSGIEAFGGTVTFKPPKRAV